MMLRSAHHVLLRCTAGAFILLTAASCNKGTAEEQNAAPEMAAVSRQDLNVRAEAAGLVEPITTVEIKSKASGEVLAVHAETGQEVQRGTLLVEVEPRDVRNAFAQAEADQVVAEARAQTSAANRKRVEQLRQQNVATEQELESAVLEEANARAQLVKARTNLELARERMRDVTITAPMSGTIIEKTIEPGFIIASASGTFGGGTTLMKMADLSVVRVRALVDQTDIGKVQPGQQVRVTVEAYPGRPFNGEVVKIEPQAVVDQNVTMFPVLVHLPNDERLLKPGMNTEVEIQIAERDGALVVPNDAVVGVRDAMTAGKALGLSEDAMREKLETLRNSARGTPTAAPGTQVAQATRSAGASAPQPSRGQAQAQRREGGRRSAGGPQRVNSRPGIVFVPGANGPEPRMVMLGVNDWDYTEVVSGLQEGEQVFLMTAARLAQQERDRADRMRQRNSSMGGLRQQQNNTQQQGGGR